MNLDEMGVLHAKSAPRWFGYESPHLYGEKPNTLRVCSEDEVAMCSQAHSIRVQESDSERHFVAAIQGVFDLTDAMTACGVTVPADKRLILICWEAS